MIQFKNISLTMLFYEILSYCIANKKFPKDIKFWTDITTAEIVANVLYCPDKETKKQEIANENEELQKLKRETNQYPTLREEELTNELDDDKPFGYPDVRKSDDELTDCERSYAKHLKAMQKEIES